MRIAVCEDERPSQEKLVELIKDWAKTRRVEIDILCYDNAEAFLFSWPDIAFDLVFLDIQMKSMTGIELAEQIRDLDNNMLLVFITSFTSYILRGYDVNALHYLIKPVSCTKLFPVLDKAQMIWNSRKSDVIIATTDTGQVKIPYDQIYFISMESHIAEIHTNKDIFRIRKTAKELEEQLPTYFIRCYRSYIVNLLKADYVYKDSLILSNEVKLPISRYASKRVNDAFLRINVG